QCPDQEIAGFDQKPVPWPKLLAPPAKEAQRPSALLCSAAIAPSRPSAVMPNGPCGECGRAPPAEMPNRAVVVASLCMLATSLRPAQSRMDHSTAPSGYQPADRRLWVRVDPEELGRVPDEPGLCLGFPPPAGH